MVLVVLIVITAITLLHFYISKHFKFWQNAGIKSIQAPTYWGALKGSLYDAPKELHTFEPDEPYVGIIKLTSLAVGIRDPDIIRAILVKEFDYFHDRGIPINEKADPLSTHLSNLSGRQWKSLRAKLTPTFSSGKLRAMFPLIKNCVDQMTDILFELADKPEAVEMNDMLSRCTTDVILSCAFGFQGNSLKDPNDIYLQMLKQHFRTTKTRYIQKVLFETFPFMTKIIPPIKQKRQATKFFINAFHAMVNERMKSNMKRNDFLDLLLEIKRNGFIAGHGNDEEDFDLNLKFTNELMAAQAWAFFAAGSETTSSAATFALVELANNTCIQERLRAEIDKSIAQNGGLTYEGVIEMPYLDQVVSEALRRHTPSTVLTRSVTKPYTMPDGRVTLPVGTRIYIHLTALHQDPKYYPEPEKFDPERFASEAVCDRHKYVFLPFGEGPRMCIALRFGLLQVKLALASLIANFEFRPKPGVPYPPVLSTKNVATSFEHGAPLLVSHRKAQ